ncbi:2-C-methyl-D-erythritol 4-phosphate cytidylyltransferase [Leucobacter tenebrionis]|uniref:2-C-methyl-D-erythritol 4-phosphate cytidylyltransferase n=1 Tax=Leucobacter tenebrionis TaxID=2873270 RepID=UPI001CA7376C|nr:2-C-methyl-D-erythritol 4-phosphate cytidylyltransferase [Leucobacter tenebrionis]
MNSLANDISGSTPHALPSLGVVLVAAGRGERLGAGAPKAFVELHGRALLEFGIGVVTSLPHTGHLVVVAPESHAALALEIVDQVLPQESPWEVSVVHGGRERHESVRFGLEALPESVETVLVHDAARPFASAELFERVLAEVVRTGDAVVPALPVVDTLKRVDEDGIVHETVDRATLVAVQTPQGFVRETLAAAHATAQIQRENDAPTDDAEVVQRAGARVRTIEGEQRAHKLTTPADLAILEHFLTENLLGREAAPAGSHGASL